MSIPESKFTFILKFGHVMKVARDMARCFWTTPELKGASLDSPIGRHLIVCQKKQAMPAKAAAIMKPTAFRHCEKVIAESASDVVESKWRGNARKALQDIFAEMARPGKRSKCPS
ncbi:hypothetical protein MRX96_003122 [Rhipicephalus microplus]